MASGASTLHVTLKSGLIFGYSLPGILVEALKGFFKKTGGFPDPHEGDINSASKTAASMLRVLIFKNFDLFE
jgi:hypothetical protein